MQKHSGYSRNGLNKTNPDDSPFFLSLISIQQMSLIIVFLIEANLSGRHYNYEHPTHIFPHQKQFTGETKNFSILQFKSRDRSKSFKGKKQWQLF